MAELQTAVTRLLGIERPVLQAPMASVATPELAAAVSAAGGLGALGSATLPAEELRRQAEAVRAATDRPFQLNFFCHPDPGELEEGDVAAARAGLAGLYADLGLGAPPPPGTPAIAFDDDRLEAVLDIRPAVVSFHFGAPEADVVAALREAGMAVLATATTVAEAQLLEELGMDGVVAQGAEAGGHRGSFLVPGDDGPVGTLALVPQVVDAVGVPVVAAGGIADGRGLAAVLALGAGAAQIGTGFLRCPESATPGFWRTAVAERAPEETVVTRALSGRPARMLRNRLTDEVSDPLPFPTQTSLTAALRDVGEDVAPLFSGQAARLAGDAPAGDLVRTITAEARRVLDSLRT
jgi:nitronate monooxygenase